MIVIQIHWSSIEKTDHHLFLQKLQLLSFQQINKKLNDQDLFSDSTLLNSLYSQSFSFFSVSFFFSTKIIQQTLFSLSSFLFTLPLQDRHSFFLQQCHSLNQMTLSHFHGLWLPLGKGMLIHSIYLPGCKVISTKSRCPCVHCDGPQEIGGILETSFYLNCEIYSYCKNVCIKINKKKF